MQNASSKVKAVCFDWGGTLMSEQGPQEVTMAKWPSVSAMPGAIAAVQELFLLYPLAIATNANISRQPDIRQALARVGLGEQFRHVFCYTDLGFKKNQAEFWQAVAEKFALPLASIAMVGDSLEHDAQAPRQFGVQAFWLAPLGSVLGKVSEVPSFHTLQEFAAWARDAA